LREQKETHILRAISEIREGMDPVVERLIRRGMERDPNARPASVAQLALALPGGDPLAAALAAGETPSPEMVAASGSKEGLRPAVAWGLLAFIIVGLLAIVAMSNGSMLHRRIPFENSPEILAERSRQFLKKAGYPEKLAYSAYGFMNNADLLSYIEKSDETANRWKDLDAKAILFWYRQSPRALGVFESVAWNTPPLQFSGEVLIMLDTEGRLVSFRAVPAKVQSFSGAAVAPDWTVFFAEAGLDPSQWKPVDPQWRPPSYADSRSAWQGSSPNRPSAPVRIEAAALQGKPISFEIIDPWTQAEQRGLTQQYSRGTFYLVGLGWLLVASTIAGGVFFARRNLRFGRGDRRSATRLALSVIGLSILAWVFQVPQVSLTNLFTLPYLAGLLWIFYIAIEPFVARRWPQILVSWTRLLSGEWRDPLVARDALIGSAIAILMQCLDRFSRYLVPSWLGYAELASPIAFSFDSVKGPRFFASDFLRAIVVGIFFAVLMICFLFIMRALLRNQKAAIAASLLFFALLDGFGNPWSFAIRLVLAAIYIFVLMRFGLMAVALVTSTKFILEGFPTTLDVSAWYFGYGFAALAILAMIVLYAFRFSLGSRPLFGTPRLDD
jgi:hypothetical protein